MIISDSSASFIEETDGFIPAVPPTSRAMKLLRNSRRCGVSIASWRTWRIQSHLIKANQAIWGPSSHGRARLRRALTFLPWISSHSSTESRSTGVRRPVARSPTKSKLVAPSRTKSHQIKPSPTILMNYRGVGRKVPKTRPRPHPLLIMP